MAVTTTVEGMRGCLEQGWDAGNALMPGAESWPQERGNPAGWPCWRPTVAAPLNSVPHRLLHASSPWTCTRSSGRNL